MRRRRWPKATFLVALHLWLAAAAPVVHADAQLLPSPYPDLAVIRVDAADIFDPGTQTLQPVSVGQAFYQFFPDLYDFLVVYPCFPHDDAGYSYYVQAQNAVQGIGLASRDISSWFASDGRLLGVAFVHGSTYPSLVLHELGHQWSAYASFCREDNSLSDELYQLPPYAPYHWQLTNMGWGVMGGRGWHDNGDGTWTKTEAPARRQYLPISLYMMGLIPPQEMPFILTLVLDQPPGWMGDTIQAHERIIPLERLLCAEGPRLPACGEAQRSFRAAFIALTLDGQPAGLSAIENCRQQVPDEFAYATGYRATMDTTLFGAFKLYLPQVARVVGG